MVSSLENLACSDPRLGESVFDFDAEGKLVFNQKLKRFQSLSNDFIERYLSQPEFNNYKRYSLSFMPAQPEICEEEKVRVLKPQFTKVFRGQIEALEFANRRFLILVVQGQVLVYRGLLSGQLIHSLPVSPFISPTHKFGPKAFYRLRLCSSLEKIAKMATYEADQTGAKL